MVGLILPLASSLAAQSTGGGAGVVTYATEAALPTPTGSGDLVYCEEVGAVLIDTSITGGHMWLPAEAVVKEDGTLYSAAYGQSSGGSVARVVAGSTITEGAEHWILGGAGAIDTADPDGVAVTGYGYMSLVGTARRFIIISKWHTVNAMAAECAVMGGSTYGGQTRYIGSRLTTGGIVQTGLYLTTTSKGLLKGETGKTIWTLVEQEAATSAIRSWSAGCQDTLGASCVSERQDMGTIGAYMELVSTNLEGTGQKSVLILAAVIELT
jgi:hypothetical protein